MNQQNLLVLLIGLFLFVCTYELEAQEWTRFRGPNGNGITESKVPVEFSATKNLKWKSQLPGAGVSCPVLLKDRVFLTCYSGYGLDRQKPGDINDLKRHVLCINREDGKIRWQQTFDAVLPEDTYSGMGVPEHGYASHTPVTDGKHVFFFLGKSGVVAFDLEGKQLWQSSVGTGSDERRWGSASSPILVGDALVIPAIAESSSIVALDKSTGKEIWRQEVAGLQKSWSTPLEVKVDDQRSDIVIGVPGEVWGINPENGKLRWLCGDIPGDSFYTSLVEQNGVIYGSIGGRRGGGTFAIRAGGKGDVTESHLAWISPEQGSFGTPLATKKNLFVFARGVLNVFDTNTGELSEKSRLGQSSSSRGGRRGGFASDYASPVLASNKLYYVRRSGDILVLELDDKIKQVAVNRVTDANDETFSASPSVGNGQLFVRSDKYLYCIEAKSENASSEFKPNP